MKKRETTYTILNSIIKANKVYEKMTRGSWLYEMGVESFLSSFLAQSLYPLMETFYPEKGLVRMEEPIASFIESNRGLKKPGRVPDALRQYGRADIALWNYDILVGVVEVKRKWSIDEFEKDYKRLRELKNRFGGDRLGDLHYAAYASFINTHKIPQDIIRRCYECRYCSECINEKVESVRYDIKQVVKDTDKIRITFIEKPYHNEYIYNDENEYAVYWASAVVVEVL